MKFTAFGSIIALALIGVAAAAPSNTPGTNPAHQDTQPGSTGTTSAHHDTQPNSPDGTTPHKTDPTSGECTPSACKTNKNPGELFCGNEAIDPNCLNGHMFKSTGGTACDLGLSDSCKN